MNDKDSRFSFSPSEKEKEQEEGREIEEWKIHSTENC